MEPFPLWLRIGHLANALLITLLIRSGIEILSAHAKLYRRDDNKDSNLLVRFTTRAMPADRLWTSDDESEAFSPGLALPGGAHLGAGRHWHFLSVLFWPLNGAIYYALLFGTGTWRTLIPTSLHVFPQALHDLATYLGGNLPPAGSPFDALQQLTYAGVVFVLAPLMLIVGAAMSPAVAGRFPSFPQAIGGRQRLRIFHFAIMSLFALFILVHIAMVGVARVQSNMAHILVGGGQFSLAIALLALVGYIAFLVLANVGATIISLRAPRGIQKWLGGITDPATGLTFGKFKSRQKYTLGDITESFRIIGYPPATPEYRAMIDSGFSKWHLDVGGDVAQPLSLTLGEILALPAAEQITEHSCIQGWTGIAKWNGVRMAEIVKLCQPLPGVKWIVFHSFARGDLDIHGHGDPTTNFYEAIPFELSYDHQTMLAYRMNGRPLAPEHGAPLRLRVEVVYGYKMVKWLERIEFVNSYRSSGKGYGGHREDSKYFGRSAYI